MVDESQEKLTPRERRAQHAKSTAIKTAPARMARKAIVPGIIILLVAAIVTGFVLTDKAQGKCPDHWHATFDIYVKDGNGTADRVSFRHNAFDLNGQTPLRAHMHQGDNKNQFHFEQGGLCVGLEEAFGYVDVELGSRSIELDGRHADLGQAGTHRANETHPVKAWIQHVSDRERTVVGNREIVTSAEMEWREHSLGTVLDYQLKDGERLLILYGTYTADEVAQLQGALAPVDGYDPALYQA